MRKITSYYKEILIMTVIFLIEISAIVRANFFFNDDLGRNIEGYTGNAFDSRYIDDTKTTKDSGTNDFGTVTYYFGPDAETAKEYKRPNAVAGIFGQSNSYIYINITNSEIFEEMTAKLRLPIKFTVKSSDVFTRINDNSAAEAA